jgi:hypothetical protein
MTESVVIERRFRGPPESANGGFACGVLAACLDGAETAEVTLRAPPPLDRPLAVERHGEGARLIDGDQLVAEAAPATALELQVPESVTLDDARRAREDSPMQREHPYPECFVCGSARTRGDGLCVTCGPIPGRDVVAAPLETDGTMADAEGRVRDELVWAALDCPGGIAGMLVPDMGISMLGRLRAAIHTPLEADREYVAIGWPISRDGRKLFAGTAILDPDGNEALAVSEAVWIELREQPPNA